MINWSLEKKLIINSIDLIENKVLFYIPNTEEIKAIDINNNLKENFESILYVHQEDDLYYKIVFLSEKYYYKIVDSRRKRKGQ